MSDNTLEAFDKIAQQYRPELLRRAVMRVQDPDLAEDLAQEALLRGFQNYHQFTPGSSLLAWLSKILERVVGQHYRYLKPEPISWETVQYNLEIIEQENLLEEAADAPLWEKTLSTEMAVAMRSLSPLLRQTMYLHAVQEWTYPEIAALEKISVGTVKMRCLRARKQLRQMLGEDYD